MPPLPDLSQSRVTLRQLRYAVALAEERHFGRAAKRCHVSQPSLSAQIQALEDGLGVPLFERTAKGVLPTQHGLSVAAQARDILSRVDRLVQDAGGPTTPLAGELRLGVIPTLGPYYLPRILPGLRARYPALRLYLREDLTERLIERLDHGGLDAVLAALPGPGGGLSERPLFQEPFRWALPPGDGLAGQACLTERQVGTGRLLLLEDGHCLRDHALAACGWATGGQPAPPQDDFAATSLATLREMVASGLGVTLLPAMACPCPGQGDLAIVPFPDPAPTRTIGLIWRASFPGQADIAALAGYLAETLPDGVLPIAGT